MTASAPVPFACYLSPADKERIAGELKDLEARRRASDRLGEGAPEYYRPPEFEIDEGKLQERERKLKGVLAKETPPKLPPQVRNSAYREFKDLVREFEDNALTHYDQGLGYPEIMKKGGHEAEQAFERAKAKCAAWEMGTRGAYVGHRLKQLAGILDPDNSELRNLDRFRRGK